MSDQPTVRCLYQVGEPPGYWHSHDCGRKATQERDGHPCCGIHARVFDRLGYWGLGSWVSS